MDPEPSTGGTFMYVAYTVPTPAVQAAEALNSQLARSFFADPHSRTPALPRSPQGARSIPRPGAGLWTAVSATRPPRFAQRAPATHRQGSSALSRGESFF